MTKKRKSGQKLPKGESLYEPALAGQAKTIILELQPIKAKGKLHYAKIAKALNIPFGTFNMWRSPKSKYYQPDLVKALAEAHEELLETIDLRKINAGVILRAQGRAKEITVIKEPVTEGPALPAFSRYTKTDLVNYARQVLKLKLRPKLAKTAMEIAIRERVVALTTEKMKITRRVEKICPTDIPAAKYANQNLGPKDKRWVDKQEHEHGISEELSNLLGLIDGSSKGKLPNRAEGQDAG